MGVALIAERPEIGVELKDNIVSTVNSDACLLKDCPFRQIEQGERGLDTVFGTRIAHYIKMYAFHDEIGVIDQ